MLQLATGLDGLQSAYTPENVAVLDSPPGLGSDACVSTTWLAVGLTEAAVNYARAVKRCPACQGRVTILGTYSWPTVRRTMSHRKLHTGCPLNPGTYFGMPSPHPQALA
jgi:hypothetical protein